MSERPADRAQRRRDALAGAKPALYLALGLGIVTGGSVMLVMVVTTLLISAAGGIGDGTSGLVALLGVGVVFWVGVSVGVIVGVTVGFRTWVALYPVYEPRTAISEQRAAVDEVELWLRKPGRD